MLGRTKQEDSAHRSLCEFIGVKSIAFGGVEEKLWPRSQARDFFGYTKETGKSQGPARPRDLKSRDQLRHCFETRLHFSAFQTLFQL